MFIILITYETAVLFLLFFILVSFPASLNGQPRADVDPEVAGVQPNISPVKIDGKILFYVGGISSYPAELRAATIAKRIKNVAENPLIPADSIVLRRQEDHFQIYAGSGFYNEYL